MKRELFHYDLPPERVACFPVADRESARLLVCSRSDPRRVEHRRVRDLPLLLRAGDVLVLNDTRVLPYRLVGHRATGGRVECLILKREGTRGEGFLRPSRRLRPGERLSMEGGSLELVITEDLGHGRHGFEIQTPDGRDPDAVLEEVGRAPLPPYLHRDANEDVEADRRRYQTVYAAKSGAVAAPTAGLHLTQRLLTELSRAGVEQIVVTLHVGEGTFEPLRATEVEEHRMHSESFELLDEAACRLTEAKATGRRVIAVGTTSARVLESCCDAATGRLTARQGETDLFLYPGRGPRFIDGLLTNFHLPESTLLLLVAAVLGRERTLELYRLAVREEYRFYSFGDAMLILP